MLAIYLVAVSLDFHSAGDTDQGLTDKEQIVLELKVEEFAKQVVIASRNKLDNQTLHTKSAPARDVSDVEECVVERSKDVSNSKDVLALADLAASIAKKIN